MGVLKYFRGDIFSCLLFLSLLLPSAMAESAEMSNASLNGTYVMTDFGADDNAWSGLIEITFDGNGNATWKDLFGSSTGTATYDVTSEGLFAAPGPTQRFNAGVVNSDGSIFTFVNPQNYDPVNTTSIKLGIKKSSGMTNASLTGTYIVVDFGADNSKPGFWSGILEVTLDGKGNSIFRDLSSGETGTGTYNVSGDGLFTANGPPQSNNVGIVSSDGSVFTFVDIDESDAHVSIKVGIKKSTGLSNASFSGTYLMCQFSADGVGINANATLFEVTSENGSATIKDLFSGETGAVTSDVSSEGLIAGTGAVGIVNSDGRIVTLVNADESDAHPSIKMGIKIDKKHTAMPWMMLLMPD